MTAKSAKKKVPSAAELKRQVAAERAANDDLKSTLNKMLESQAALAAKVERLMELPTARQAKAEHDPSALVASQVLREKVEDTGLPPKPDNPLPDHLKAFVESQNGDYQARHHPRQPSNGLDTREMDVTQLDERPMRSTGPARDALAPINYDDGAIHENKRWSRDKLEHEAFMHELVCVRLHDTTDETMIPMPSACNGGINQMFVRNRDQWVKRKFLEPLARAKRTTYTQRKVRDEQGNETYIQVPHTALMYPFEVLQDSDKGKAWLRGIIAEPF